MRPHTLRLTALLGLGLLLLATTQPWVELVVAAAPGLPGRPQERGPGPWVAAVSLAGVVALLLALLRPLPLLRAVAVVATVGVAAGMARLGLVAPEASGELLERSRTGWYAVALVCALLTPALLLGAEALARRVGERRRPARPAPPHPDERTRRQEAQLWADLSLGRDPTHAARDGALPPTADGTGTIGPDHRSGPGAAHAHGSNEEHR